MNEMIRPDVEIERLRKHIQLHAGDTQSLSNEVEMWRERALWAEEQLAAAAFTATVNPSETSPPLGSQGKNEKNALPDAAIKARARLLEDTSAKRKEYPITEGFLDYFPDAVACVSEVSFLGNEKHNPGEKLHWARGKSMDHANCIGRHLIERGGYDIIVINGVERKVRHSAALAWRAMANLQEELEEEYLLPPPRGATTE